VLNPRQACIYWIENLVTWQIGLGRGSDARYEICLAKNFFMIDLMLDNLLMEVQEVKKLVTKPGNNWTKVQRQDNHNVNQ